jgi:hypothetical protein
MELFVELAPNEIDGHPRTHKVACKDVAEFKRYVRGQVTGVKQKERRLTLAQEKTHATLPAWAIVKTNSSPATEANTLFIVGAAYHDGRLIPFEKTYSPQFIEGQEKIHAS